MIRQRASRTVVAAIALAAGSIGSCKDVAGPIIITAPTDVTVTLLTPTSARITWVAPPEASIVVSYNVIRDGTKIGETSTTTYVDNGLVEGITYHYQVSAKGIAGELSELSAESPAATITAPDVTPPVVLATSPAPGANAVARAATITATFSENLDPTTIDATTFIVKGAGGVTVPGTVTYNAAARVAEFKADGTLPNSAAIVVTVTTGVKDPGGNKLAADFSFSFSTRDEVSPVVTSTSPASATSGVAVSAAIKVSFDEDLDPATVTASSIVLTKASNGAVVGASVSFDPASKTATLTPSAALESLTGYSVTVLTAVKDVAGNALATAHSFSFTTADASAPSILSVSPANAATSVSVDATVSVAFSEPMDPATISATTITLRATESGAPVTGAVGYTAANSGTFAPSSPLSYSTSYTVAVTTGAKDLGGNSITGDFSSEFTTAAQPDNTSPAVSSTIPANGAVSVPVGAAIAATFTEGMEVTSVNAATFIVTVASNGASVSGVVTYDVATSTAMFTPAVALAFGTAYTATISTGARDAAGNPLSAPHSWSFSTAAAPDLLAPTVVATAPADGDAGISVNAVVTVTFSEAMDPSTINGATIRLTNASTSAAIAGAVGYNPGNNSATFSPNSALDFATSYSVTVTTGAKDASGNPLATIFTAVFATAAAPDTSSPTVLVVVPSNGATGVAIGAAVTVTFSELMNPATVNSTTFNVKVTTSGLTVAGSISYDAATNTATFAPGSPLAYSTGYSVSVTTGAKDAAGNALATPFTATFATTSAPDTSPPTVLSVAPANGAAGVPIGTAVTVTFSEPMNSATINSTTFGLKVTSSGVALAGSISYNAATNTATFTPASPLAYSTTYTVTVTTGAKDAAGNALATPFTAAFTTAPAPDTSPPTVLTVSPTNAATNVAIGTAVTVAFSEPMNSATITSTTFTVKVASSGATVSGSVSYNAGSRTATFTPTSPLAYSTGYTVTVTTGAKDLAENGLSSAFTSGFTTIAPPDTTAPTVSGTQPSDGATNVPISSVVTVTFSEPMSAATISGTNIKLRITATSADVPGVVSYNPGTNTATFSPGSSLAYSTGYTIVVTTSVRDQAGNPLATEFGASFTTPPPPDTTAPTVISTSPANGATEVPPGALVTVTFSESIDPATINGSTFGVVEVSTGAAVSGAVSYDASTKVATFTPSSSLGSAEYRATVTTGVKDIAGNALAANVSFTFTGAFVHNLTAYWSGTPADGSIHVHFTLDHTAGSSTFSLRPNNCGGQQANCRVYPLTVAGQAWIEDPEYVDVAAARGTFSNPQATIIFTTANGVEFTYIATVSEFSSKLTGMISSRNMPSTYLEMEKAGP